MPEDLAAGKETVFWWKGNVTPPDDWSKWEELIRQFILHIIDRYGLSEVLKWHFEIWNEPDLEGFWQNADFDKYIKLYRITASVIKNIDSRFKVGGPATSGTRDKPGCAPWGDQFLKACREQKIPLDFFSTHPYPTFHPVDFECHGYMKWDNELRLLKDLNGYNRLLKKYGYQNIEKYYTEWNSSPSPRDSVHDTAFMAPFIVKNNWLARGKTDSLTYWEASDIFEENRLGDTPFHGGFGMLNIQGLKKPSFHAYWFLSKLGNSELGSGDNYAVTQHENGIISILLWNYCHYLPVANDHRKFQNADGKSIYNLFEESNNTVFEIPLNCFNKSLHVKETRFDRNNGSVFDSWLSLGAENHILPEKLIELKKHMELTQKVFEVPVAGQQLKYIVPPHGIIMLDIEIDN